MRTHHPAHAMNTRLDYLYRDAANYKTHGTHVFAGPPEAPLIDRLRAALFDREYLVASQVGIPAVAPWMLGDATYDESVDHLLHEVLWPPSPTSADPTDPGISFKEFVRQVEEASRSGWDFANPPSHRANS